MGSQGGIGHLADLARLALPGDELASLGRDMESIMRLMDTLQSVDLGGEEEDGEGVTLAELRGDGAFQRIPPEAFLEQSPAEGRDGFTIPRMME